MLEAKIGEEASFQIFEASNRETRGELDFLVKEAIHSHIEWTAEKEEFFTFAVGMLDKEKIIDAAMNKYKESFTKLLNETIDSILEG